MSYHQIPCKPTGIGLKYGIGTDRQFINLFACLGCAAGIVTGRPDLFATMLSSRRNKIPVKFAAVGTYRSASCRRYDFRSQTGLPVDYSLHSSVARQRQLRASFTRHFHRERQQRVRCSPPRGTDASAQTTPSPPARKAAPAR